MKIQIGSGVELCIGDTKVGRVESVNEDRPFKMFDPSAGSSTFAFGEITYAKAGGPPHPWHGLRVFDLDTGKEIADVEEVDAGAGWLIRAKRDADGQLYLEGDEIARERLEGRFQIRPPT